MAGTRAILVAFCILLLATVAGYQITSGVKVAGFMLFIAAVWFAVERVVMTSRARKTPPKGR